MSVSSRANVVYPGILGVHERDAVLEIERVDDVALALMQVDRSGMDRCGRLAGTGTAQHPAGAGLQDRDLPAR